MRQKLIAEFLGTYFLMFLGTGAIVVNELTQTLSPMWISFLFGMLVMVIIYAFGHISGAHINPAVTIGFFVNKDIGGKEAVCYILTQLIGAIVASYSLFFLFGNVANLGAVVPQISWEKSFIIELLLMFMLMLVIFTSAVHGKAIKSFAGVVIGGAVIVADMFGGVLSGAALNPARTFAPAIVSGVWEYQWMYITATLVGAVLAARVYRLLCENQDK